MATRDEAIQEVKVAYAELVAATDALVLARARYDAASRVARAEHDLKASAATVNLSGPAAIAGRVAPLVILAESVVFKEPSERA
jgi:hypothetical protein